MSVWEKIRIIAVIVGAVVGAGFATGGEINLYFGGKSVLSPLISALFFAIFTAIFMYSGKIEEGRIARRVTDVFVSISSLIIFLTMSACFNQILSVPLSGAICSCACLLLNGREGRGLKLLNLLCVPVIIALITALSIKKGNVIPSGEGLGLVRALGYAALNFMTAGYLVRGAGKVATRRDIYFISIGVGLAIAILLVLVRGITFDSSSKVPLLSEAERCGMGVVASVIVFLAVFTTQLSTVAVLERGIFRLIGSEGLAILTAFSLAFVGECIGFDVLVNACYPAVSVIGVIYLTYTVFSVIKGFGIYGRPHMPKLSRDDVF